MNIWLFFFVVFLSVWIMYSTSKAERERLQRLADPNSAEAMKARQLIESLPDEVRSSIEREVADGKLLNGVKKLRASVKGLGLYDAKNAIELLKRQSRCA